LDTDDDNKYKRIRRIIDKPIVTEDTNPWVTIQVEIGFIRL
jgi:hypothetical protein